jgi:hypothetical protein
MTAKKTEKKKSPISAPKKKSPETKSPISEITPEMKAKKDEFIADYEKHAKKSKNEPQDVPSERVAASDSQLVRTFWLQKEKVWKKESELKKLSIAEQLELDLKK